jgi:Bax protein
LGLKAALLAGLSVGVLSARGPDGQWPSPQALIPPFLQAVTLKGGDVDAPWRGRGHAPDAIADRPAFDLETPGPAQTVVASRPAPKVPSDLPAYDLEAVKAGLHPAPRLAPQRVPDDLAALDAGESRKQAFVALVLPLVLQVNEEVSHNRQQVTALLRKAESGSRLDARDQAFLERMFSRYRVEPGDFDQLLVHLDTVPPSLALAQAAIESGWGSSRFALEGNALFGQWTWDAATPGLDPVDRPEGMAHRIRAFETPLDAVRAYMRNLNTHVAYAGLRELRAEQRRTGRLDPMELANGLLAYSEKGEDYVTLVRQVIRSNDLGAFDRVRLANRAEGA